MIVVLKLIISPARQYRLARSPLDGVADRSPHALGCGRNRYISHAEWRERVDDSIDQRGRHSVIARLGAAFDAEKFVFVGVSATSESMRSGIISARGMQ